MMSARLGVFGAAVSALLIYGFSSGPAANAPPATANSAGQDAAANASPSMRVDNFMLVDAQKLEAHELYRLPDAKAIVLISTGVGCPIARSLTPAIKALRDK